MHHPDANLAFDIGTHAAETGLMSMMAALEVIPDGKARNAALCIAIASVQYKVAGLRKLMTPADNRLVDATDAILMKGLDAALARSAAEPG